MLRSKQYLVLTIFLVALTSLAYILPKWLWLWATIFVIAGVATVFRELLRSFLMLERLLQREDFSNLRTLSEEMLSNPQKKGSHSIATVYLLASLLSTNPQDERAYIDELFSKVQPESLKARFKNRYFILQARRAIYDDDAPKAVDLLKQCSFDGLGMFHLAELLFYLSLSFYLCQDEQQRCIQYAGKASTLRESNPLYRALSGLTLLELGGNPSGKKILKQAIDDFSVSAFTWEKAFFRQRFEATP